MMLSCWSVACLVCGRVGGCGVVGWRVPGRAGDVWLVAERDGRTLVGSFLCGCWIGVRQGLVRSYPSRCLSRRRVRATRKVVWAVQGCGLGGDGWAAAVRD